MNHRYNTNICPISLNGTSSTTEQAKMDNLAYQYAADSSNNKLNTVTEKLLRGTNANGQHNDITSIQNYTYDELRYKQSGR